MAATTRAITPTTSDPFRHSSRSRTPDLPAAAGHLAQQAAVSPSKRAAALLDSKMAHSSDAAPAQIPQTLSPEPLAAGIAVAGAAAAGSQGRAPSPLRNVAVRSTPPPVDPAMSRPKDAAPQPATAMMVAATSPALSATAGGGAVKEADATPSTTMAANATAAGPDVKMTDKPAETATSNGVAQNGSTGAANLASSLVEGTSAATATATEASTSAPVAIDRALASEAALQQAANVTITQSPPSTSGGDTNNTNRAMTFPAPMPSVEQVRRATPSRGMSLPGSGYGPGSSPRSPSTKRHKCPYCETDFTRHHNLKSHLLTHSQEKPYECPTCQARFRRLHDLKRHTKLHTGERPHTCPKCGRRFARGDALARHNKGPGGCAGRRSSFGDEDGIEGRDSMDGVLYHGENGSAHGDDDRMDEDAGPSPAGGRRVSESSKSIRSRQGSGQGPYPPFSGGSTYPPVSSQHVTPAKSSGSSRALLPPPSTSGSGPAREASSGTSNLSPKPAGSSIPSLHFTGGQSGASIISQGGISESPRPLSPGQGEHGAHSHSQSHPPARMYHPQNESTSPGSMPARSPGASSLGSAFPRGPSGLHAQLPPHNAPQLPQLPGLGPAPMAKGMIPQPASSSGQHRGSGSSSSNPGSGGSLREVLEGGAPGPAAPAMSAIDHREAELWKYVQNLEERFSRLQEIHESKISELTGEISGLKRELGR